MLETAPGGSKHFTSTQGIIYPSHVGVFARKTFWHPSNASPTGVVLSSYTPGGVHVIFS